MRILFLLQEKISKIEDYMSKNSYQVHDEKIILKDEWEQVGVLFRNLNIDHKIKTKLIPPLTTLKHEHDLLAKKIELLYPKTIEIKLNSYISEDHLEMILKLEQQANKQTRRE